VRSLRDMAHALEGRLTDGSAAFALLEDGKREVESRLASVSAELDEQRKQSEAQIIAAQPREQLFQAQYDGVVRELA